MCPRPPRSRTTVGIAVPIRLMSSTDSIVASMTADGRATGLTTDMLTLPFEECTTYILCMLYTLDTLGHNRQGVDMAKQGAAPPIWTLPAPPTRSWGLDRSEIV